MRTDLTEAQIVMCRRQLHSNECPVCRRSKSSRDCFCRTCYFALPDRLRAALWIPRLSVGDLLEWSERYTAAKNHLRSKGMAGSDEQAYREYLRQYGSEDQRAYDLSAEKRMVRGGRRA